MHPWDAILNFRISELKETRWMVPEEGQPRSAPGPHQSPNYLEGGEKLAQMEVTRGEGWGKSHPKSRLETANSENSGNGGENSRISGHRVVPDSHQDISCRCASWVSDGRRALRPWGTSLFPEPQFFCRFQACRVRRVFVHRCQKTPAGLERAVVPGSSLVSPSTDR